MPVEGCADFEVTCDRCGKTIEVDSTEYAGEPTSWGVDDDDLNAVGWIREGTATYCPNCQGDDDDAETTDEAA